MTAVCPGNKRAIGGGAAVSAGGDENVALYVTQPTVGVAGLPNGWIAEAGETDSTSATWSVTAVALCATIE